MAMSDITTVWRPVKPWVDPVVTEICRTKRIYFVWGKSGGHSGEHPLGRALDFSVLEYGQGVNRPGPARKALGDEIATYLWTHRKRLNLWYVIWNRRIISASPSGYAYNRWTKYRGSNPHTDHVHVSFNASGVYHLPTDRSDDKDDMPLTSAEKREIAQLAADRVWSWDRIRNTSVKDKKDPAYFWTPATFLAHIEASQDAQYTALRKAISAIGAALGPAVGKAVQEALKDAVVKVDVDVHQPSANQGNQGEGDHA